MWRRGCNILICTCVKGKLSMNWGRVLSGFFKGSVQVSVANACLQFQLQMFGTKFMNQLCFKLHNNSLVHKPAKQSHIKTFPFPYYLQLSASNFSFYWLSRVTRTVLMLSFWLLKLNQRIWILGEGEKGLKRKLGKFASLKLRPGIKSTGNIEI